MQGLNFCGIHEVLFIVNFKIYKHGAKVIGLQNENISPQKHVGFQNNYLPSKITTHIRAQYNSRSLVKIWTSESHDR